MDSKQLVILAFQIAIAGTVFGFGLKATLGDVLYLARRPGLLARSLLSVFVVMPLLAVVFVKLFELKLTTEVVLVALAISPVPPLLPKNEVKASGHASYGLGLMVFLAVAAIALVPLSVEAMELAFGRPYAVESGAIAKIVLMLIVLPLVAGMIVHTLLPRVSARLQKPVGAAATALLVIAAVFLLAGAWKAIWAATGSGTVLAIALFVVSGLIVGHLLGGPEPEHSAVLAMSTACRHPAIALAIAIANYPGERFVGTILLYVLVNTVLWIAYARWSAKRSAPAVQA